MTKFEVSLSSFDMMLPSLTTEQEIISRWATAYANAKRRREREREFVREGMRRNPRRSEAY